MTTTITFSGGTLGAAADWATTHPIVMSGTGAKTIRAANVAGDPYDITLGGVLSGAANVPLTKTGAGTLTLAANNSRAGVTTINDGAISVGTIGNGGVASNLGQAALAATNLVINGGTLRYTGAGSNTDRLFQIGQTAAGGTATLDASGAGALNFTSGGNLTFGTNNQTRTLVLTGSSAANNTLNPGLGNNGSGVTSLVKSGPGTWVLTGAKTFGGSVSIEEGTLSVNSTLAAGGLVVVEDSGTLAGTGTVNKPITLNAGGTISPAGPATGTLVAGSVLWNGGGALAIDVGATSDVLALSGALSKGDAGSYSIAFGDSAPVPGFFYTLATYGSTDFTSDDLGYAGISSYLGVLLVEPTSLRFVAAAGGPGAVYDLWTYLNGLPADQRGFDDNPTGDGTSNGLKFYLGKNPNEASPQGIVATTVNVGGVIYPAVSFDRRENLGGVVGIVIVSPDLGFASDLGSVEVSSDSLGNGMEHVVVRSLVPLSQTPAQFFRVIASLPGE
jgi:autotransporter-associated beta strand protein